MDLKGTIVSATLRIYPTEKLVTYLQTLPAEDLANNFQPFLKAAKELDYRSTHNGVIEGSGLSSIHLNHKDLHNLKQIKKAIKTEATDIPHPKEEPEKKIPKESVEETGDESKNDKDKQGPYLSTADMEWLYIYLQKRRKQNKDTPYLHELFEGSNIEMPENTIIKRDPVLEARCVKLRAQQEAREYRKMTRGVDNVRMRFPDDSIAYQMKQINRQLIAIGQFIISIFAGFLFGFRGVEWLVGNLDFGFRLLLGVMCALVIALAEIYFLAKKLNEELSVPETVQLGGPPKFVDKEKYGYGPADTVTKKEHQD